MSRALRLIALAILTVAIQVNLVEYVRIASVAPDIMIAVLIAITGYCGGYGGFCTGATMALLYDASVGYVVAINLIGYTAIGYYAPAFRKKLDDAFRPIFKHKSFLVLFLSCFFFALLREILYIGYLFLIGSEQGIVTILRALLCSAYTAFMVFMVQPMVRFMLTYHPIKKEKTDLIEDPVVTETRR